MIEASHDHVCLHCSFACKLVCAVMTGRKEKSESVITLYKLQAVIVITSSVCDFTCSSFEVQTIVCDLCCQTNVPQQGSCMQRGRPAGNKSIAAAFSLSSVNRRHGAGYCTHEEMLDSKSFTGARGSLLQSGLIAVLKS